MDRLHIQLDIEELEEGGYVATSPDVQGLVVQAATVGELLDCAQDTSLKLMESCVERDDVPPSARPPTMSAGFLGFVTTYVGDSKHVGRRIRRNHCRNHVYGSALRRHVARGMGFTVTAERRLQHEDPAAAEQAITDYMKSGWWQYVCCDSPGEARRFQWYVIEHMNPALNRDRRPWDDASEPRFRQLLAELLDSRRLTWDEFSNDHDCPGVYVFYHREPPRFLQQVSL